jgi:hypothetical protein
MRDGSTRRPATTSSSRTWAPERVQVQHWRQRHRGEAIRRLAARAHGLDWTRGLFLAALDELHVTDEFDRLVGATTRVPASQYPRLIAIALLLRHSWWPEDLSRLATRVGIDVGPLASERNPFDCDCFRRRRAIRRHGVKADERPHVAKAGK